MKVGTWNGPSTLDNVRVTVNGTVRPVRSVSIDSGMRDGHPLSESSSWCVESTIEWVAPPLVFSDAPHPFGVGTEWLPKAGDTVVIETGEGSTGQWWVQHRGVIDDTSGSFAAGTATSTTVDAIDELAGITSIGPLMAKMWPGAGSTTYRGIGLMSTYHVDRMLRTAQRDTFGWYATPPRTWETLGSMPGQGSLWPEVGEVINCDKKVGGGTGPAWIKTPYGVAPVDYTSTTTLIGSTAEPILTVAITDGYTGSNTGTVRVCDSDGMGAYIGRETTGDVITYGTYTSSGLHWSVPRNNATRAALYFKRINSTSQTLILRLNDGREFTQTATRTDFPSGWAADRVRVDSSAGLGWWMVEGAKPSAPEYRWATLNHVPTARIRVSDIPWWKASRGLASVDVSEFLAEQVDAECSQMWLDEDGVMQWAGRGVLEAQPVVNTITSPAMNVRDVRWEQRRRRLAKSVLVTSEDLRIDMGYQGQVTRTLWEDDGVDVGPGETEIIPVSVPADRDWLGVDITPHHVSGYGHSFDYYRVGSTYGGTQYRTSDSEDQAWAAFLDCTMTRESLTDYTIEFGAWSSIPGSHRVKTSLPTTTTAFVRSGGTALALRGRAQLIVTKREATRGAGSKGVNQYTHDVGWRVQTLSAGFDGVDDLVTFLSSVLADSTKPRITGLTIEHDPRHQIGDKIRVQDSGVTGLDWDQLIQERSVRIDKDTFEETITGRVTLVRSTPAPGTRLTPAGHTALTPASNWNREVA